MMIERPQFSQFNREDHYRRAVYYTLARVLAEARHAWDYGTKAEYEAMALLVHQLETEISIRRGRDLRVVVHIEEAIAYSVRHMFPTAPPLFGETLPERWDPKPRW